jgi:osmotically inducible protein OsmC
VSMRNIDGLPTLQRIDLEVEGQVPGLDTERFAQHAEQARTGCAVSRALRGVEQITVSARLRP